MDISSLYKVLNMDLIKHAELVQSYVEKVNTTGRFQPQRYYDGHNNAPSVYSHC